MAKNTIKLSYPGKDNLDEDRVTMLKSFKIYKDQFQRIGNLVNKNALAGIQPYSISGVVRAAIDEYLEKNGFKVS